MSKRTVVAALSLMVVALMAVAPAMAVEQPAPRSYIWFDPTGTPQECFDFKTSGRMVMGLTNIGNRGTFQTMDISEMTGTPADSLYWGKTHNNFFYGVFVRKTEFHGTCEMQGAANWTIGDFGEGTASCGFTSFHRIPGIGNFNDNGSMAQIGDSAGRTCSGVTAGLSDTPLAPPATVPTDKAD